MRNLIVLFTILVTMTSVHANSTAIEWIRGVSESEVETKMLKRVEEINKSRRIRSTINSTICENPKVYEVSAPKKSFRVNSHGELIAKWTSVIKMSCSNKDNLSE
jgi:hypothetical protein